MFSFKMYLRLLSIQLRSQMQFRFSFWLELLSTAFISGSFFLSLALVFQRFDQVGGWRFGEIAFLIGMIETSFGTMDLIFSGFDDTFFSSLIQLGALDQILLRPVQTFWQVLGSRLLLRRIGRIAQGLVILGLSITMVEIHWTLGRALYLPVVLVSQIVAMGSLFIVGTTITFWTVQSVEAINILTYGGTELMSYPTPIYPVWMQRFFTYIVPFIFLNYYPALYFLNKPDPLPWAGLPFLAPLMAVVMFGAALRFWKFGLDRYQSTGS